MSDIPENEQSKNNEAKSGSPSSGAASFECSICLDVAKEPVVVKCGHLFCWPCIYSWNQQKNTCPNCNNPISKNDFIPIYNKDQNSQNTNRFKIPERPKGERNPGTGSSNQGSSSPFSNFNMGFGFFGLPFFGFNFNVGGGERANFANPASSLLNLENLRVSNNESINKAARHFISLLLMLLFYIMLTL